jgi:predicted heme/steroid binding protein/uncharacterized membrane protein
LSGAGKEISLKELEEANGADGRPVYIVYQDRVIDVSASPRWEGGHHMEIHQAGADLTQEIVAAPHGLEVLERYPQIGVLVQAGKDTAAEGLGRVSATGPGKAPVPRPAVPKPLAALLRRVPLLRRHPHPMVVHFPIVFMIATTFFTLLSVITGDRPFETTALNCLGGGVLFTPVAAGTGLFTWWLNYELRPLRPVIIKIILTSIMFVMAMVTFVWRLLDPEVLAQLHGLSLLYFGLILLLAPLAGAIGWYGASLTFPVPAD